MENQNPQIPPQNIPTEPPVEQPTSSGLMKKIIIAVAVITVIAAIGTGGYLLGNKKNVTPQVPNQSTSTFPISNPSAAFDKFDEKLIIKLSAFTNSTGEPKRFIIVKTGDRDGIPIADAYISDPNLSKSSAVKISALSGEDAGFGRFLVEFTNEMLVSFSPGPGKKFIIVSYQIADSFPTLLLDEKGILISTDVSGNSVELVKDKCQCGFGFDYWIDQDEFYVEVRTAGGGDYTIRVDANTGKTVGLPQKKD